MPSEQTNHRALLERIEYATRPNKQLDADIAKSLGHEISWQQANYTMETYPVILWREPHLYAGMKEPCPTFTASIDAALALVERVLPGACWMLNKEHHDGPFRHAEITPVPADGKSWIGADLYSGEAATTPLAILAALLSALIAQEAGHAVR